MVKREVNNLKKFSLIFIILLSIGLFINSLYGASFFNSGASFNGTFYNTVYNGSSVVISGTNTSGSYTSIVFDAGANATWNNLTYSITNPSISYLYAVDRAGNVFSSNNSAVNWTQTISGYGRTTDTAYLFSNNNYLFIISSSNKELWRSPNGTTFTVINSTFSSNTLLYGDVDSNGSLYEAGGSGSFYRSADNGLTWSLQGDANGAATNAAKGIAINNSDVIFVVDGGGAVWKSSNQGANWTQINASYGGAASTADMDVDSNGNLYILLAKQVYKSNTSGVNWVVVNNSFTPYTNDAQNLYIDNNNNLFIADTNGRVFKSNNSGVVWTELGDFNGAATNNPAGITNFTKYTNVTLSVMNCSSSDCSDGSFSFVNLNNINKTGRYFKYRVNFSSNDSAITPQLFNVTVNYNLLNTPPNITILSPIEGTVYDYNKSISLNYSASDINGNLDTCWYNLDNGDNTTLASCVNTTLTNVGNGTHYVNLYSNDTQNAISLSRVNFSVLNTAPIISISSPQNTSYVFNLSQSLQLNYSVSDINNNTDKCWYNLNDGTNVSITSCSNTTFSVPSAGSYILKIYANDSYNLIGTSNVSFASVNNAPSISILYPQEGGSYGINRNLSLNYTVSDVDNNLDKCWYNINNGANTILLGCSNTTLNISVNGSYSIGLSANDTGGLISTSQVNFSVLNTAPSVLILSPQNGASYGTNLSLKLNYSASDVDNNLDKCWYNINNVSNISLSNCQNITFNVSGNGNYVVNVYANDSFNLIGTDSSSFTVNIGSPSVILNYPSDNAYLNNHNISFNYTPSDIDLASCELWGNFSGVFALNKTTLIPINNSVNSFALNLSDGGYLWNVRCNDTAGHSAFNGNKTLFIDSISPVLTLTEPTGTKTSRTGIPLITSVSDNSPVNCTYNITTSIGNPVITNVNVTNCATTSFDVSLDGDYLASVKVIDAAGNFNSSNSSFSVNTIISPPSGGSGGGSGSGGSSSGGSYILPNRTGTIESSDLNNIILHSGDKKTLSLLVKNTGVAFLNNCKLIFKGNISNWFYSTQSQGVAPGESVNFVFDLNVPQDANPNKYSQEVDIKCDEKFESKFFNVNIPSGLDFVQIKEVKSEYRKVTVNYVIDTRSLIGENVDVVVWISDEQGNEIVRKVDNVPINKDGSIDRTISIDLPSNVVGVYYVNIALANDPTNLIRQSVVLGSSSATGFAIFNTTTGKIIGIVIFVLFLGVGIFFILRNYIKKNKSHEHHDSHNKFYGHKNEWLLPSRKFKDGVESLFG